MSLLELDHVCKSYGHGAHRPVALDDVCLTLETGELVAVWGTRRSGRSTLLRVAAGVEPPDAGSVRLYHEDIGASGPRALTGGVAYCRRGFAAGEGSLVFDQLLSAQEALGTPRSVAAARALDALRRTGAERCGQLAPHDLDGAETIRVMLARAIAPRPRMLVVDEPTMGVDLAARDCILGLLRSIADEGVSILMSTGETPCLTVADRALSIDAGRLRGQVARPLAAVVALRPAAQPAA